MSKFPFPCLESSSTPSNLPKPCMRKHHFQNKTCCSRKSTTEFRKNMGLPSEANVLENFPKPSWSSSEMICWTVSQPHSLKKSSCEIPFATMFVFQKIHVMHSHLISRLPDAYEMHYAISTQSNQYIKYAYILKFTITPHVIQQYQPAPKLAHLS